MDESLKSIENAAKLAGEKGLVRFTRFLDPAQAIQASGLAREYGAQVMLWGGYDRAERVIAGFYPYHEQINASMYPLVCLHTKYAEKFCSVSHRDLLGSFMSLGLTRSCLGDIIIVGADIYLFVYAQTADFIAQSMSSAGKTQLRFSVLNEIPQMPEPEGTRYSAVVSSLRLDSVIAAAYRLSRSDSADLIRAGLVKVDHMACERVDMNVRENTLFSIRGKGRIRLLSIDGMTKKQRIGITFFRYE